MKITKIERAKKNKLKVNIFIDGEYSFSIFEDVFLKIKIETGMKIDESFVTKVKKADIFEKNKHYLLNILSRKNYTEKELLNKLLIRKIEKNTAIKLINHIKQMGILNDEKYLKDYFSYLVDARKYSRCEIFFKMKMKFSKEEYLIKVEEWLKEYNERDILLESLKNKAVWTEEKKIILQFVRKGFNYDDVLFVLGKIKKEE